MKGIATVESLTRESFFTPNGKKPMHRVGVRAKLDGQAGGHDGNIFLLVPKHLADEYRLGRVLNVTVTPRRERRRRRAQKAKKK